jgi:hypothetical protein
MDANEQLQAFGGLADPDNYSQRRVVDDACAKVNSRHRLECILAIRVLSAFTQNVARISANRASSWQLLTIVPLQVAE